MVPRFPSEEWLKDLHANLNNDARYARIARGWEGDVSLVIEPDEQFSERVICYLDLWHGSSRGVRYIRGAGEESASFVISAPFTNWLRILQGDLNPVQAMATMKLRVRGSMSYMMRNIPSVLDFTRCAQETPHQV